MNKLIEDIVEAAVGLLKMAETVVIYAVIFATVLDYLSPTVGVALALLNLANVIRKRDNN
jgi:hypothetical protein